MLWESLRISVVVVPVADFLRLPLSPDPKLQKRCRRAHSVDKTAEIKMLADQPEVADICLYYVCVLHTVITFGRAPLWNQHSWLFENSPTHLIPQLSTVQAGAVCAH